MEWTNSSLMNIIWIKSFVFSSGKDIFKGHRNPQYYHDESCRNSNRSLEMPLQKLETLGLHIRNQPLFLSFYLMFIILSSNSWMSDLIFKQNSPFMYLPHQKLHVFPLPLPTKQNLRFITALILISSNNNACIFHKCYWSYIFKRLIWKLMGAVASAIERKSMRRRHSARLQNHWI